MGIVYLLTHEIMPGLTKIGRTDQTVEDRMRSLNNTSVPFGFECFYAAEVKDSVDVEKRLHDAFQDLNIGKEFFKMHLRRFSMFRIGLKAGDTLTFARGENITAEVVSDSEVNFEGSVLSLTASALIAIKRCGYQWDRISGPVFWMHNGQPLKEIERDYLDRQ